jgi:hypothetical protein
VTRDSAHTGRDLAGSLNGTSRASVSVQPVNNNSNKDGMRDSVFRRFSLLKGVGRKTSRMDFKANGTLQEE